MGEISSSNGGDHGVLPLGQPQEATNSEQPHTDMTAAERTASEMWEAAHELRVAQEGWLERRNVLEDTARLTMTRREFELLRDVGLGDNGGVATSLLVGKARESYGIPSDAQYASVDVVPNDVTLPNATKLVDVNEADFGTVVDEGILESHGIEPEDLPCTTMNEREFGLFRMTGITGSGIITYARDLCSIPQDDQYAPEYALIDIESGDPDQPDEPLLVIVNELDFGTVIDRGVIDKDNDYLNDDPDPDNPLTLESGDRYVTVDIKDTLIKSRQGISMFAAELMRDQTTNPLGGDSWVRAGGIAPDQKYAYVWEANGTRFKRAVELTVAFPEQYNSVCVVAGERLDPANAKITMAQIKDPTEVFKIEGENLKRLQEVYSELYHQPYFALTEEQQRVRDEIFNDHLAHRISYEASKNRAIEEKARQDQRRKRQQFAEQTYEIPSP